MCVAALTLTDVHVFWSRVVIIYTVLIALWGLLLVIRRADIGGGYMGSLVIAEGIIAVQAILGIALLIQGQRPHDSLHYLYGVVALLTLPGAYLYTLQGTVRGSSLILAIACVFLIGICIRAITTGM